MLALEMNETRLIPPPPCLILKVRPGPLRYIGKFPAWTMTLDCASFVAFQGRGHEPLPHNAT
jgi:hypothetical protein